MPRAAITSRRPLRSGRAAQAADYGQQVGDALAEQRFAQDQRRPGIVLFVIVLAAMARGTSAELGAASPRPRRSGAQAAQPCSASRLDSAALRRRAAAGRLEHDYERPFRIALL